jgi:hypothetical protein
MTISAYCLWWVSRLLGTVGPRITLPGVLRRAVYRIVDGNGQRLRSTFRELDARADRQRDEGKRQLVSDSAGAGLTDDPIVAVCCQHPVHGQHVLLKAGSEQLRPELDCGGSRSPAGPGAGDCHWDLGSRGSLWDGIPMRRALPVGLSAPAVLQHGMPFQV